MAIVDQELGTSDGGGLCGICLLPYLLLHGYCGRVHKANGVLACVGDVVLLTIDGV
jgi:hypothetical protein